MGERISDFPTRIQKWLRMNELAIVPWMLLYTDGESRWSNQIKNTESWQWEKESVIFWLGSKSEWEWIRWQLSEKKKTA